ncbi:MAG: PhnD/SsuA/transferrin family substrate-binding protein [Sulfuriflexus sp.]|nr:PhnD/SsuA/transferrin family substrate-binding protein [Sulfuriflexus sp.]
MCFLKSKIKLLLLGVLIASPILTYADTIKIGLRAHNGVSKGLLQWQATANYLSKAIPQHEFLFIPVVGLDELMQAAARNEFDFILTNPSSFVEMKVRFGVSALVTLKNKRQGKPYTQFGSVIFTLASRKDINEIADLKGKVLVAVSDKAFGGWWVALREILKNGINQDDFSQINFSGGIQSDVVDLVGAGVADVGIVRTDMLERLSADGSIDINLFKIINQHKTEGFPFYHSTPLYPEWAFAKMQNTSEDLSKQVALALLAIKSSQNAARNGLYIGWTVPQNYEPVHELMRELGVGPYVNFNKSLWQRVYSQYRFEAVIVFILFIMLLIGISYIVLHNRRLEARVWHRTAALSQAKDEADKANLAKSDFLSKMSHELRTPMNAILGYAQLIEYQSEYINKQQQKEFVGEILHAGKHLLDLINDLLDVAKIEAGKYEVEVKPVILFDIVNECISLVSILARAKKIEIQNQLSEDDKLTVLIDRRSFKQILINLLSNAIKYNSEEGVVTINIEHPDNSKYYVLNVIDTGDGISEEQLDTIFDEFHRSTERSGVEGSGIGLGISKQLVEAMGGELRVKSELGKGSQFSLYIINS